MTMNNETAILDAALTVLEAQGPGGLTTRAICEAAGVKSPTLYHYFGDKDGLEQALVRRGLADFMRRKQQSTAVEDPLEQLRAGWDVALEFALKRPALYALLSLHVRSQPALVAEAYALMQSRVQRLVDMGRLQGPVDATARAVWAASQGALSLVHLGASRKEIEAVSDLLFKSVMKGLSPAAP
ncbi:TetR/AcrR family transcriptional regulator [Sphaerotilus hippei]|nr:TetR/AcrR family transcriptional regulator [Sphaerotilus hippei]